MDDINYPVISNAGLAELIGKPGDMSKEFIKKHEPFTDKVFPFSNLTEVELSKIFDDVFIKSIQKRSRMTRWEKQHFYDRSDYTDIRAYLTASASLGKDGFLVKRITSSYKNISMTQGDGMQKRGLLGGIFKRGGGESVD
jgi:hypothetical protein